MHSIDDRGYLQTDSDLSNDLGPTIAMALPKPNGKTYNIKKSESSFFIDKSFLQKFIENDDPTDFPEEFIQVATNVLNSDSTDIAVNDVAIEGDPYTMRDYVQALREFVGYLNTHSHSKITREKSEDVLKNRIVGRINELNQKPQNQYSALMPIDMTEQQNAAKMSSLGAAEKHISSDCASTVFMMQKQNMVGKEVIGITAVGLKGFFGLSTYYGLKINNVVKQLQQIDWTTPNLGEVKSLIYNVINTTNNGEIISPLANLDYSEILDVLDNAVLINPSDELLNLRQQVRQAQVYANTNDAALAISGLLSAATDFQCNE